MTKPAARDKRRLPRLPPRFPVDIPAHFREIGDVDWREGTLVNLSEGGLCLQVMNPPHQGAFLEIVTISKDEKNKTRRRVLKAHVVWRKGSRCGLEFV